MICELSHSDKKENENAIVISIVFLCYFSTFLV